MPGVLTRRSAVKLAAALTAAPATAMGAGAAAGGAVRRGGRLIYARRADCRTLDPVAAETDADIALLPNFYGTLLTLAPDGKTILPGLATAWALSNGGSTLTLTLRQGVRFSDGTALRTTDVKWSLDRACNVASGPSARYLSTIAGVAVTGAETVTITLTRPDPMILPALAAFNAAILPAAREVAAPGDLSAHKPWDFAHHPIGTGPFVLAEWKPGEAMVLRRNPHYAKKAPDGGRLPYLDEIELPVIADDSTRLAVLASGGADGAEFVPFSRVAALRTETALRVELWPSTRVSFLTLNCRPAFADGKKNPMADVRVRRALNHALDKAAVIAAATSGLGTPTTSFMSRATPLHAGRGMPYPHDPALAKKLLTEAGFAGGFDLTGITRAGSRSDTDIMTVVQGMWNAVGVKLKLAPMETSKLLASYKAGNFEVLPAAWADRIADPAPITARFAYSPAIGCLHSGWKDTTVDALFLRTQTELDPAARAAEYRKLQEIYVSEAPIVFLDEAPFALAWRKQVTGFIQCPLGSSIFEYTSL